MLAIFSYTSHDNGIEQPISSRRQDHEADSSFWVRLSRSRPFARSVAPIPLADAPKGLQNFPRQPSFGPANEIVNGNVMRDFDEQMHVVIWQRAIDDRQAHHGAGLPPATPRPRRADDRDGSTWRTRRRNCWPQAHALKNGERLRGQSGDPMTRSSPTRE